MEERRGAPGQSYAAFLGPGQVQGERPQEGVKLGLALQSSVSVSGDKDGSAGTVSEAGWFSGRFCCRIIFHRVQKSAEGRFVLERS